MSGNGEEVPSVALRVQILASLAAALRTQWATGDDAVLRAVWERPWRPGTPAPAATVTDLGIQTREHWGERDSEVIGGQQILRCGITLDLPANWDRDEGAKAWATVVEGIHVVVNRWPDGEGVSGFGIVTARVVSDEPLEAVLEGGKSTHIWALEAEIDFAGTWPAA